MSRFGFPPVRTAAARLAIAIVASSILAALLEQATGLSLRLIPEMVLRGWVWQPLTYIPVEFSPGGIIFGALIVWSFGGSLESTWGSRRLLLFSLGVTFVAGLLTLALSLAVPSLRGVGYAGGGVMAGIIWVGYGLSFGRMQTNFWGMPVTGNLLALMGVGFVVLNAVFGGWRAVVPEAFGLLLTFLYLRVGTPRLLWLRIQSWRLRRQLKGRSRHLTVVKGEGERPPSGSDRYLH
jgi:membrane associated rhomboid family serine protease